MTSQRRPSAVPKLASRAEPVSRQKLRLWLRLLKTSRAVEAELRERLRLTFGTTLPKFDVMAALERQPAGLTMTELSRFLMVSNGNVTGIVDRLVAEGLVVRRAARAGSALHLRAPDPEGCTPVCGHGQSPRGLGRRNSGPHHCRGSPRHHRAAEPIGASGQETCGDRELGGPQCSPDCLRVSRLPAAAHVVRPEGSGRTRSQCPCRHLHARQLAPCGAVARSGARSTRIPIPRLPERRRRAHRSHGREGLRRQHRADRQRPPAHLQGAHRLVEPPRARSGRGLRRATGQSRAHPVRQQPRHGCGLAGGHQVRRRGRQHHADAACRRTRQDRRQGRDRPGAHRFPHRRRAGRLCQGKHLPEEGRQFRRHRQPRCGARSRRVEQVRQVRGGADRAGRRGVAGVHVRHHRRAQGAPCTSTATC